MFFRRMILLIQKDFLVEMRNRETFTLMFFFAILMLFLFQFTLRPEESQLPQMIPGLLWLAIAFMGTLGLGKAFVAEQRNDCLEELLLIPGDRGWIYVGKLIGNTLFMLAVEGLMVPLLALLFPFPLWRLLPSLLAIMLLGTLGLATLGTFFSALTANVRAREVLFPFLLLPLAIPLFIATAGSTEIVIQGGSLGEAASWLKLLVTFDMIFLTVTVLAFEAMMEQ
ncbi:MAG: heme exporter protein CcmB [Candidatus Tectomicrobia bacterium]|nr:heme exporter protein CcmB [Candidatus Tectomicrobia bacterium]